MTQINAAFYHNNKTHALLLGLPVGRQSLGFGLLSVYLFIYLSSSTCKRARDHGVEAACDLT